MTTFEFKGSSEYGAVIVNGNHLYKDTSYSRIIYQLLRCAGCGRAGLAKIHCDNTVSEGVLESFFPTTIKKASIPSNVPKEIVADFREAELCASTGAWRSASAMLRSALEKLLKSNGYTKGKLIEKIDTANNDGVITESRKKKAHEDIRSLGNDVLHEEWREINEDEFETAHHYTQRVFEDFYDDRETVEKILEEKGRLQIEQSQDEPQVNV
ncbi:MAG: DUF4145 domain-containing protein [Anaerolineaceae bacterium]